MKIWILLFSFCFVACSSPKPPPVKVRPLPASTIGTETATAVRYPESIKAYHVGRYVEPHNQLVMHEHHTVYRVEALPNWDLHPRPPCASQAPSVAALTNSAYAPAPANDDIIAELNRQKQITQAVTAEANKLTGSLQELGQAIAETRTIAQENNELRRQLSGALKRIESLEAEVKKQQTASMDGGSFSQPAPE